MKTVPFFTILVLAMGAFVVSADAQRRRAPRRTPPAAKPAPKPPVTAAIILAKKKVSAQLSNINRFVTLLGPIAQGIEDIDEQAKTRQLPKKALDENKANKEKVVLAIGNFRAGMATLEAEFRTKPDLKKFLPNINGITDLTARSEDEALAGRFIGSREPLREVAKKLSDTLAAMP